MKIEIINSLRFAHFPGIASQIDRVKSGKSDLVMLATPDLDNVKMAEEQGLALDKVYDVFRGELLSQTAHDETKGIWWANAPMPKNARIEVNDNWTISVLQSGHEIAQVTWFDGDNRFVQDVRWLDDNGDYDFVESYDRYGNLFSKIYYSHGDVLQMDYYFGQEEPVVTSYSYMGQLNFIKAGEIEVKNLDEFVKARIQATPYGQSATTEFIIAETGRELDFAPAVTTLIPVKVADDNQNVYPVLLELLSNPDFVPNVSTVQLDQNQLALIKTQSPTLNRVASI